MGQREQIQHWDSIYQEKQPHEMSWTQEDPQTSLDFIHSFQLSKQAKIIDVGGGSSRLADHLLQEGFEDITVLDISAQALEKAKNRLGPEAEKVKWIVSDVTDFKPAVTYDVWHDRATFHFLTTPEQIEKYIDVAKRAVSGYLAMGTFSDKGPEQCSGLPVKRYAEDELAAALATGFSKIRCITEDHITPVGKRQNFLFCSFKRKAA